MTSLSYRIGSALDRFLSIVSPKKAALRAQYRNMYFGYEAAYPTRKDLPFPFDGRAEGMAKASRKTLRARARDLERNSDFAACILEAIDRNVVGSQLGMQAQTPSDKLNQRIEELWSQWIYPENCDVTGQQSFEELYSMVVRRWFVDGGVLIVYNTDLSKPIPLTLQVREVDDLSDGSYPIKPDGSTVYSDGVEMTREGKPVAYWLNTVDANGFETVDPERIPADRVTFLWKKERPSQFREITPLGKSVPRIKDLEDYNNDVAFQQKMLASMSVFIERDENTPTTPIGRIANTKDGKRITQVRAGSATYLNNGEKVKALIPSGQAAEFSDYETSQMRTVAASHGLSLEGVSRNVERVNYSSARQNLIEDDKTYSKMKKYLQVHFLREVYKRFVDACFLRGLLDGYGFNPSDPTMYENKWMTEGMPWIDPLKEAQADDVQLQNCTTTLQEVCARNGKDWQEVLDQREREMQELKKRGLTQEGDANGNQNGKPPKPDSGSGSDDGEGGGEQS